MNTFKDRTIRRRLNIRKIIDIGRIVRDAVCAYASHHEILHRGIGILGNGMFVAGSAASLFYNADHISTLLFFAAASGMLIDRMFAAAAAYHRHAAKTE